MISFLVFFIKFFHKKFKVFNHMLAYILIRFNLILFQ